MIAAKLMNIDENTITMETTGIEALANMEDLKVSHLAIIDNNNKYIGLISESALFALSQPENSLKENNVRPVKLFAHDHQHFYELAEIFINNKISLLPVVNKSMKHIGSIMLFDLLNAFGMMAAVQEPGGIIILEVGVRDYKLTEIAGIVESNDTKILSIHTFSPVDSTKLEVTLKLNKRDIAGVLQTFNRFNYIIKASFIEENSEDYLKERYKSLMNYLNIGDQ